MDLHLRSDYYKYDALRTPSPIVRDGWADTKEYKLCDDISLILIAMK